MIENINITYDSLNMYELDVHAYFFSIYAYMHISKEKVVEK